MSFSGFPDEGLVFYEGLEADNTKAAQRLASDMGEFFMPFPGTRINQQTVPLDANGMTGVASYYEVKFTDTNKCVNLYINKIAKISRNKSVSKAIPPYFAECNSVNRMLDIEYQP
mgnify:CR=1 FL=1